MHAVQHQIHLTPCEQGWLVSGPDGRGIAFKTLAEAMRAADGCLADLKAAVFVINGTDGFVSVGSGRLPSW